MKWRYFPVLTLALPPGIVPRGKSTAVSANFPVQRSAANIRHGRSRTASGFALHDSPHWIGGMTVRQRRVCHGAGGTRRNRTGRVLKPHPRDLTSRAGMFRTAVRDGLPGAAMPAWKSVHIEAQVRATSTYLSTGPFIHPMPARHPAAGAVGACP